MDARLIIAGALALALACSACTAPQVRTITDYCTPWRPIYISTQDVLTDATARAILAHDETGAKLCGWTPRKAK